MRVTWNARGPEALRRRDAQRPGKKPQVSRQNASSLEGEDSKKKQTRPEGRHPTQTETPLMKKNIARINKSILM